MFIIILKYVSLDKISRQIIIDFFNVIFITSLLLTYIYEHTLLNKLLFFIVF